jgi:protein TonB
MATAVANSSESNFGVYVTASSVLHAALLVLLGLSAYFHWERGNQWTSAGGGGEDVKVKLVGSAGVPMPRPTVAESQVVDPTKSLYKPEEAPKLPDPLPSEKLPEFKHEKPLPPPVHKSKIFENKTVEKPNVVPGNGGAPKIPTGVGDKAGSTPGLEVKGQGGGDFGSRYGWYIEAVKRRIQTNWLQSSIDPGVRSAHAAKATLQFTINRDGSVKDISISQSSGNLSMDNSGKRAIMASDPMPRLPPDYSGSYVTVLFDFDLSMTR